MSEKDFTIMHSRNMQQVSVTQRITKVLTLFITYAFLIVMALIVLFPFYWMIISSLKSLDEYRASVPTFWPSATMRMRSPPAIWAACSSTPPMLASSRRCCP